MLKEERLKQIEYVVENSEYVKINERKIDEFVGSINEELDYKHWLSDYKTKFTENEMILFLFFIESMNFCFWKEPFFTFQNTKRSEAMFYLWLNATLNHNELLSLSYLEKLKYEDFIEIFGVEEGNLKNRYNLLKETVKTIIEKTNFFENIYSIKTIDSLYKFIVENFKSFKDVAWYKGKEIFFYKRATLLVNDLFELCDTINKNIISIDDCLGCADYVIPKGLRSLGILEYNVELSNLIDTEKLIEKYSEYEVEIRANMLWTLEMIKNKLNDRGIYINSVRLDNIIWKKCRGKQGKSHRTDTIYY